MQLYGHRNKLFLSNVPEMGLGTEIKLSFFNFVAQNMCTQV